MITSRHSAKKRGRQAGSILRRWRAGYLVDTIAFELRITINEVAAILAADGIDKSLIEERTRVKSAAEV
jgi:hypothetical protein